MGEPVAEKGNQLHHREAIETYENGDAKEDPNGVTDTVVVDRCEEMIVPNPNDAEEKLQGGDEEDAKEAANHSDPVEVDRSGEMIVQNPNDGDDKLQGGDEDAKEAANCSDPVEVDRSGKMIVPNPNDAEEKLQGGDEDAKEAANHSDPVEVDRSGEMIVPNPNDGDDKLQGGDEDAKEAANCSDPVEVDRSGEMIVQNPNDAEEKLQGGDEDAKEAANHSDPVEVDRSGEMMVPNPNDGDDKLQGGDEDAKEAANCSDPVEVDRSGKMIVPNPNDAEEKLQGGNEEDAKEAANHSDPVEVDRSGEMIVPNPNDGDDKLQGGDEDAKEAANRSDPVEVDRSGKMIVPNPDNAEEKLQGGDEDAKDPVEVISQRLNDVLIVQNPLEVVPDTKWIKHYSNKHKILLVGEGDFSFAVSLAKAFGSATNMVATSLDSKRMLLNSYSAARQNLKQLEELGCSVFHGVCAYTMSEHKSLCLKQFDRIVFNFPHAGFHYREHQIEQIQLHQDLVSGFFGSAMKMLTSGGQVHITHKTSHPFCKWEVKDLAMDVGLRLVEEVPFYLFEYPGYQNKKGDGFFTDSSFPVGACSTYKFRL